MMLGLRYEDEDGNDAGAMSDRQVRDEAMTMFAAGQGTSTMALAWTWYLLATHPTVQERFHREVDEALDGRPPTPADLPNLPLTDRIVTESMRLYPPVYTTAQTAAEPFELGGYQVPAGALLTAPQIVVHRDARWFDEPDAFRPERWTPEFRKSLHRYAYFPYGGGPRLCIGDRFSEMAVRLIMASFGQRWKARPDPAHEVELMPYLTLKAKGGLPLFLGAARLNRWILERSRRWLARAHRSETVARYLRPIARASGGPAPSISTSPSSTCASRPRAMSRRMPPWMRSLASTPPR